jgi:hypothetical protein
MRRTIGEIAKFVTSKNAGPFLWLLLLGLFPTSATAQAVRTSPSEILGNADRFDGQAVTISGTVTNFQEQVTRAGRSYYTFDLSDGTEAVRVSSFGKAPCKSGGATVDGTFTKAKQQGQSTFYNEVTATRVRCR